MRVTQLPATGNKPSPKQRETVYMNPPINHYYSAPDIKKLFSGFEKDDYILAGLIAVLVFEGCDDYILLAALGYLFIKGFRES